MDSWRKRPEQMLAVGDCVVVATKGSALFVFDANSARLLRKFDVAPMTKLLGTYIHVTIKTVRSI